MKEIKNIFRSIFIEGNREDIVFDVEDLVTEEEKVEKETKSKQEVN